ncbi:MAG: ankyrin repeat domain-containing protein, partial [Phycisphaerales bacterium]|nr:ankyrin repeat domain-containing protein [Phycisphaerales bacterium]
MRMKLIAILSVLLVDFSGSESRAQAQDDPVQDKPVQSQPVDPEQRKSSFDQLKKLCENPRTTAAQVKALIQDGADVNAQDNVLAYTPLHTVVDMYGQPDVIMALLESGADVSLRDDDGFTPLGLAVQNWRVLQERQPEVVALLLKAGSDPNGYEGSEHYSPLSLAVGQCSPETISVLIKAGADVEARRGETYTSTPLGVAIQFNRDPEATRLLIQAGVDVNRRCVVHYTPLMLSCETSNPEIVTLLLQAGANVNARDTTGQTALDYAQENRKLAGSPVLRQLEAATNLRASN